MVRVDAVDPVEHRPGLGELQAQVGQHVRILGPLPGEHEHDLPVPAERLGLEVDPGGRLDPGAARLGQLLDRLPELLAEVLDRGADDGQPPRSRGAAELTGEREREVREGRLGRTPDRRHQLAGGLEQRLPGVRLEHAHLAVPGRAVVRARVLAPFLEHGVGVDAPEPEGVDAGPPGLAAAVDPGPGLGVDVERGPLQLELRVGLVARQRRRQHAVVERERGLDQAGDPGGGDRVADHRLDRSEPAPRQLPVALPEHACERVHLHHVPDRGAGAVRLQQPDARGGDPGGVIGASQRQLLALQSRRHHAHPASVARHPDAPDHGVHAVAVPFGVLDPLEHDGADPLPQEGAVGVLVEGPQLLAPRQRSQPAEEVQGGDRHPHLGAAGEHEVAVPGEQVADGVTDGEQRGGAGGIDRVGGAHQVEPVRDPPDDDVRDQPRDGFGAERWKHTLQLSPQQRELLLGPLRVELADQIHRLPHHEPPLDRDRVAAVEVGALAEDHSGAGPHLVRQLGGAGVPEGFTGDVQREPLVGLAPDGHRRDAVVERVELGQLAEVPTPFAVGAVFVLEVGVVVDLGVPRLRRGVGGGVDLGEDVPPVGVHVAGAREHAGHSGDRDRARGACARNGAHAGAPASRFSACEPTPTTSRSSARGRPSDP